MKLFINTSAFIILSVIHYSAIAEITELNIIDGGNNIGYPPYYYYENNSGKSPQGIVPDIIREAAKEINIHLNWESLPWNRALNQIKSGKADAMFPIMKTKIRESFLYFPKTELSYEENSFFVHKNSHINYSGNLQELSQYQIGGIETYSYGEKFDTAKETGVIKLEKVFNDEQLMRMFINNRFEIGVGNKSVLLWHFKKNHPSHDVKFLLPIISRDPLFIAFSKKTKGIKVIVDKFSNALTKMKTDGRLSAIHLKYGVHIEPIK